MRVDLRNCSPVESVEFVFKNMKVELRYHIAETKTLFFNGQVDKYPLSGFVYNGEEKWTLGGSLINCGALGKNDYKEFLELLSKTVRFNGFRFDASENKEEKKRIREKKKESERTAPSVAETVETTMAESVKRKRGRPKKQPEAV